MAAVLSVGIVNGVPTTGTGEVMTIDTIIAKLGTGATNLSKAEDAAHASGDNGILALVVRRDTATSSTSPACAGRRP